jgi:hypothetical protein
MGTKRFLKSRDERKRVEMRFAHLKIHHGFERMRFLGPNRLVFLGIWAQSSRQVLLNA